MTSQCLKLQSLFPGANESNHTCRVSYHWQKNLSLDPSIDCGGRTIANLIIDHQSLIHARRTVSFELATRGGTLSRQNTAISHRISSFSGTNDDITTWKSSPYTGPLWGKPAWPVNAPHIGPIRWTRKIDGWSNAMTYVIQQKKSWQKSLEHKSLSKMFTFLSIILSLWYNNHTNYFMFIQSIGDCPFPETK